MIKDFLTGRWFTVIAPPSFYTSRALNYTEARKLCKDMRGYFKVFDPFGTFRRKYVENIFK